MYKFPCSFASLFQKETSVSLPAIYDDFLNKYIRNNSITALLGPRQCGKTTIAKTIASNQESTYFDL